MKQKGILYNVFRIIACLLLIISLSYMVVYTAGIIDQKRYDLTVSAMYNKISLSNESGGESQISRTGKQSTERFEQFLRVNSDFSGMLLIPGLKIEYPFVQGKENNHYLRHDFRGEESARGAIFLDYRNSSGLDDRNNVLYGHNMKDGSMFNALSKYADPATVEQAPKIITDCLSGRSEWLVFAAYVCEADCGYTNICASDESFKRLLDSIEERNMLKTGIDINTGDIILTLSTCNYSFENARFAVHARKMRPDES